MNQRVTIGYAWIQSNACTNKAVPFETSAFVKKNTGGKNFFVFIQKRLTINGTLWTR